MRIWFECIKPFRDKSKTKASPFLGLNRSKYQYSYSEVYLGAKGKVTCLDKKIEFFMSFSVRDGILVKIRKKQPYRVLFHYVDGAYYTNDEANIMYEQLINAFSMLKNEAKYYHHMEVYEKLEAIIYNFIIMYF